MKAAVRNARVKIVKKEMKITHFFFLLRKHKHFASYKRFNSLS